jgi:hypothetical protein
MNEFRMAQQVTYFLGHDDDGGGGGSGELCHTCDTEVIFIYEFKQIF